MAETKQDAALADKAETIRQALLEAGPRLDPRERASLLRAIRSLTGKTLPDDSVAMIRTMRDRK